MRAVTFGEGMVELSRGAGGEALIGIGGDTLNTAVYLARLGTPVSFMTALGHDPWSRQLRESIAAEGVDTSLIAVHPSRVVGLYGISLGPEGQRSFTYWRESSAARAFFDCPDAELILATATQASLLLLSGITLALYTPAERRRIAVLASRVRSAGGQVAFDPNYRARLWPSVEAYQVALQDLAGAISIALPSFEDESQVWRDPSPEETLRRWLDLGVPEVVVKDGARGALTGHGWVGADVAAAVDTTGAGDSFNAAYLSARLSGATALDAAVAGNALAGLVVRHYGAIAPKDAVAGVSGAVQ